MPQRVARLSLLTSLHHQATTVLAAVTKEIRQREQELAALKAEAARWQSVLRVPVRGDGSAVPTPHRRAAKRPRLDWHTILKELPTRFTIKDLAQKTGRPMAHAYTYVSRWMKAKKVRRGKDGYEKV
jgi:hypothetical protein